MMDRRAFMGTLAMSALVAPAEAQLQGSHPRIGFFSAITPEQTIPYDDAFREGLRKLGYIEGQNVVIERRYAHGRPERFPEVAAELVQLNVDVIVAANNPAVAATQRATRTIPIVMVFGIDPVSLGFVASLARPGGNITGLSSQIPDLAAKRLQLFKEAVPNLSRVAVLWDPTEPGRRPEVTETEAVARALGVSLLVMEARNPDEISSAFEVMTRRGVRAVMVHGSSMLYVHRTKIAELATKSRLPAMCALHPYVEVGCLVSYAPSFTDMSRRAATYVDKILKGAKPAELPVEQPTKFDLVINMNTAKALGLTIPPSVLLRADRVIE